MARGKFFVIEGMDGSGKSTQLGMIQARLADRNLAAHFTAEPTARPIGLMIRQVLEKKLKVSPATLAGLFLADRLDHLENQEDGMLGLLEQGTHVVSDRYYWSSYAYHSLDVPMEWVIELNTACADRLRPDVTFYLDLPAEVSMERINARSEGKELFEKTDTLRRVRENYLQAIRTQQSKERVVVIDAQQAPSAIFETIWKRMEAVLS